MRLALVILVASLVSCFSQASKTPPIANLIGWWTLNDNTTPANGALVADFGPNNYNGYMTNTLGTLPSWTTGLIGLAFNPGGVLPGEVAVATNYTGLQTLQSNQFSVCVWFKMQPVLTIPSDQGLVGKDDGNVTSGWLIDLISNSGLTPTLFVERSSINFRISGNPITYASSSNAWHFVSFGLSNNPAVAALTGTNCYSYTDGSFSRNITAAGSGTWGTDANTAMTFCFSKFKGASTAVIDEVRIYNRVLQQWELDAIYHGGYGRAEP